jgi:RNA recognition motif-containing protein
MLLEKSRGFAFVTYKDPNDAYKAVELEHMIQSKIVDCKIAFTKNKARTKVLDEKTRKLFIGGLSPDTNTSNKNYRFFRYFIY